ncbi:heavy metal-associated isoprenylated plant protein 45-like isoform X1 [Chenopodium quinoa]|uniref:heavy metal-associated isoprenylated plant protein 45-like isoform X1 n=1 Tax=Chenopodium quinoa TaxID=63459 RepID=UPI000B7761F4|nr:heavy metal-associated isoprenylated plant protein 45-like isoform X1 [Chenopodium quinoa]
MPHLRLHGHVYIQMVELKVGLHCDECIKKILKAIKKIEDIETYNIDTRLNKVTVTGNVTEEEVIRVIHKIGKTASSWDDRKESTNVSAGYM